MIVILLIPIIFLGMPAGRGDDRGGQLAQLRQKYELGETSLGNVPPASATMNLLLLGLRGVACNVLWQQAIEQKEHKDWGGLRATTDSIILLQPHFRQVWEFQAWNLAYNVSAEWDGVIDRYHWVKEGAKFMIRGTEVNRNIPDLKYETGRMIGQKIGHSDEWKLFRKYFFHDPDDENYNVNLPPDDPENQKIGADSILNPELKDNYLVASDWYHKAVDLVAGRAGQEVRQQHRESPVLFYSRPYMAWIGRADALNREGIYDDSSRRAWEDAHRQWTVEFGTNTKFPTSAGNVVLEYNNEVLEALVKEDGDKFTKKQKQLVAKSMQDMINYRDWRERTDAERQHSMELAHQQLSDGKKAFTREQDLKKSFDLLQSGLKNMEDALRNYPNLAANNRELVEECVKAVIVYKNLHELLGMQMPENYPLKYLVEQHPAQLAEFQDLFQKTFGGN
jgi:hypothetical protein